MALLSSVSVCACFCSALFITNQCSVGVELVWISGTICVSPQKNATNICIKIDTYLLSNNAMAAKKNRSSDRSQRPRPKTK